MDTGPIVSSVTGNAWFAPLGHLGALSVSGEDARAFLHSQLSTDIATLAADRARRAGYCSAKGRLLASLLVVPCSDGFLLQLSRDLAPAIAKRLAMYVLRSKVKIADASEAWAQFGVWGPARASRLKAAGLPVPDEALQVANSQDVVVVSLTDGRTLLFARSPVATRLAEHFAPGQADQWMLADIRAGLPLISQATQEQFVPQMANFDLIGGVDFKKGCYPGQEIVARTQYRGALKRRMYRGQTAAPDGPRPGQGLFALEFPGQACGDVLSAAPRQEGGYELLAVLHSTVVERGDAIHLGAPDGPLVHIATLPYAL